MYRIVYITVSTVCTDYMTLLFLLYYSGPPNDLGDYDETPDVTAQHMKVCLCLHCFIAQFLCLWWSTLLTLF